MTVIEIIWFRLELKGLNSFGDYQTVPPLHKIMGLFFFSFLPHPHRAGLADPKDEKITVRAAGVRNRAATKRMSLCTMKRWVLWRNPPTEMPRIHF